jgi:hypothetical protein
VVDVPIQVQVAYANAEPHFLIMFFHGWKMPEFIIDGPSGNDGKLPEGYVALDRLLGSQISQEPGTGRPDQDVPSLPQDLEFAKVKTLWRTWNPSPYLDLFPHHRIFVHGDVVTGQDPGQALLEEVKNGNSQFVGVPVSRILKVVQQGSYCICE